MFYDSSCVGLNGWLHCDSCFDSVNNYRYPLEDDLWCEFTPPSQRLMVCLLSRKFFHPEWGRIHSSCFLIWWSFIVSSGSRLLLVTGIWIRFLNDSLSGTGTQGLYSTRVLRSSNVFEVGLFYSRRVFLFGTNWVSLLIYCIWIYTPPWSVVLFDDDDEQQWSYGFYVLEKLESCTNQNQNS